MAFSIIKFTLFTFLTLGLLEECQGSNPINRHLKRTKSGSGSKSSKSSKSSDSKSSDSKSLSVQTCFDHPSAKAFVKKNKEGITCDNLSTMKDKEEAATICNIVNGDDDYQAARNVCPETCGTCGIPSSCVEDANSSFYYKTVNKNNLTRECWWLYANPEKVKQTCKRISSPKGLSLAGSVCPIQCGTCDSYEVKLKLSTDDDHWKKLWWYLLDYEVLYYGPYEVQKQKRTYEPNKNYSYTFFIKQCDLHWFAAETADEVTYKMVVDGKKETVKDGSKYLDVCQNDNTVRVQILFYVGDNPESIAWKLFDENDIENGGKILIDSSIRTQPYENDRRYSFYWSLKKCNPYRMKFATSGLGAKSWFLVHVNGDVVASFRSSDSVKINICDE